MVDFPGGTVDKNPLANAGECEFDYWPMKILHAAEQLSRAPQLPSLCAATTEAPDEKSPQQEAHAAQQRVLVCDN